MSYRCNNSERQMKARRFAAMPRLKEVDSLQQLANRVLLSSLVQCCEKFCSESCTGALIRLREAIGAIKETILDRMPPSLKADFLANLMNDCASFLRDQSHGTTVLEIIMDTEIIGLRLTGQIVRFMRPDDAPRFRRLKDLDLSHAQGIVDETSDEDESSEDTSDEDESSEDTSEEDTSDEDTSEEDTSDEDDDDVHRLHVDLEKFQLNDLTSIRYPKKCTDSDLEIIGRNCPHIEILDLYDSESVTDAGMRFLSSCPNLRVVKVEGCSNLSYVSLSFLLSGHKKLEDFSYGYYEKYRELYGVPNWMEVSKLDMLSGLDLTLQCPSLIRFIYENNKDFSPAVELKAIVAKFPNLKYLRINCFQAEDLSSVKYLNKLTELRVDFDDESHIDTRVASWLSFQELMTVIGANLTSLAVHRGSLLKQDDVNFIFKSCPNLEHLLIDHFVAVPSGTLPLVIPPFPKLKGLVFFPREHYRLCDIPVDESIPKFGNLLNLEVLSLLYMRIDTSFLESVMLDDVNFPKLRVVKINSLGSRALAKIVQTARDNNLDFCTSDDGLAPYYDDTDSYSVYDCDSWVDIDCHDFSD